MRQEQEFPNHDVSYPALHDRWALIIATSTKWSNYRFQADAFAMYKLLRKHGLDDDHIVLIVSDGYARSANNPTPGVIKVRSDGENVYAPEGIDYDIKDIEPSDLEAILSGKQSERLPHVLHPTANDNVFVFWTGHGAPMELPWMDSYRSVKAGEIRAMLERLSAEKRYRQMLFAIEACYSGGIGKTCEGIPGLLMLTAANADEPSWAEIRDPQLGIYLSNAFTREFEESIDENPDIPLRELYYHLSRATWGSHVMVYNSYLFGNMQTNTMRQFIPR